MKRAAPFSPFCGRCQLRFASIAGKTSDSLGATLAGSASRSATPPGPLARARLPCKQSGMPSGISAAVSRPPIAYRRRPQQSRDRRRARRFDEDPFRVASQRCAARISSSRYDIDRSVALFDGADWPAPSSPGSQSESRVATVSGLGTTLPPEDRRGARSLETDHFRTPRRFAQGRYSWYPAQYAADVSRVAHR